MKFMLGLFALATVAVLIALVLGLIDLIAGNVSFGAFLVREGLLLVLFIVISMIGQSLWLRAGSPDPDDL
jgi:hypothetical protein